MDYLAGLSDEDDGDGDDKGALDYGIGTGGVVYESAAPEPAMQRQASAEKEGSDDNDYADDFD